MSSENPLTVTLSVSSLNLNRSRSYGATGSLNAPFLFPSYGPRGRAGTIPRGYHSRSYRDAFALPPPPLPPSIRDYPRVLSGDPGRHGEKSARRTTRDRPGRTVSNRDRARRVDSSRA